MCTKQLLNIISLEIIMATIRLLSQGFTGHPSVQSVKYFHKITSNIIDPSICCRDENLVCSETHHCDQNTLIYLDQDLLHSHCHSLTLSCCRPCWRNHTESRTWSSRRHRLTAPSRSPRSWCSCRSWRCRGRC